MQREIKFRFWDKVLNKMIHRHLHPYDCEHKEIEVMQYIGLKDKNNKEIYEGDIILGKFQIEEVEDYIYNNLTPKEIKAQSKIFVVENIHFGYEYAIPEDLEILGNIHENPELLNN